MKRREDWRARAACRDVEPELFYPVGTSGPALEQVAEAKAVCGRCSVRDACLVDALKVPAAQQFGVWGGLDEDERAELLRARGRSARRVSWGAPDAPAALAAG